MSDRTERQVGGAFGPSRCTGRFVGRLSVLPQGAAGTKLSIDGASEMPEARRSIAVKYEGMGVQMVVGATGLPRGR